MLVATLIIASLALGLVAYNMHRINTLLQSQEETSKKIDNLSSNISAVSEALSKLQRSQEASRESLAAEITTLKSIVDELKSRIKNLEERQSAQTANLTQTFSVIKNLEEELSRLEAALNSQTANITSLASQLHDMEARIDKLYSLLLFPVTVTDATGKPLTVPSRPDRIVSLLPSVTEILWAVNASSQVIAVDEYSNYPPDVVESVKNGTIINIGSGWYPNVELILSLKPDLVIGVDSVVSHHTLKDILGQYGIPVLLLPDKDFNDVLDSILLVGRATGHPAEAAQLAARLKSEATSLRAFINSYLMKTGEPRAKVALVVWVKPLWIAGSNTFENDIVLMAGGLNAYSNITGWKAVGPETLIAANPDVIVITVGYSGINMSRADFIAYLRSVLGDAVYNITAVKTGRIYFVSGDYNDMLVRPSPRIVKGALLMSVILYPQAFNLTASQLPEHVTPETFKLPSLPSG